MPLPLPTAGQHWALFLDIDGTLAHIAPTPDAASVDDAVRDSLARLAHACGGALAVVSGRNLEKIDQLLAPLRLPAAGLHGLEVRGADGRVHRLAPGAGPAPAERAALARFADTHPGTLVEDKGSAVALHFRGAPEAEAEVDTLVTRLADCRDGRLVVQRGKMVRELRPAGSDKGSAIVLFLEQPPFAGRIPVYIGDDVTDEAAFAVVNARGGISIRVGNGTETVARHRITSVAQVHEWLAALAGRLEAECR